MEAWIGNNEGKQNKMHVTLCRNIIMLYERTPWSGVSP
jgi:hypothetical protein